MNLAHNATTEQRTDMKRTTRALRTMRLSNAQFVRRFGMPGTTIAARFS